MRWALLQGDPAPGRPDEVLAAGRALQAGARLAEEAHTALDDVGLSVGDSGWEGEAADQFVEVFGTLPPQLLVLSEAYEVVGGAMVQYADRLEELQRRAEQALNRAEAAREAAQQAEVNRDAALRQLQQHRERYAHHDREAASALSDANRSLAVGDEWGYDRALSDRDWHLSQRSAAGQDVGTWDRAARDHERAGEAAGTELRSATTEASTIRQEHRWAAEAVIGAIDRSLPESWKNLSNLEKALGVAGAAVLAVGEAYWNTVVDPALDGLGALLRGDAVGVVHAFHRYLEVLDLALFVVGVVLLFTPVGPAVIAALALTTAVVGILKLGTTSILAANGRTDEDGRPIASWGDVGWAAVGAVAGAGALRHTDTLGTFGRRILSGGDEISRASSPIATVFAGRFASYRFPHRLAGSEITSELGRFLGPKAAVDLIGLLDYRNKIDNARKVVTGIGSWAGPAWETAQDRYDVITGSLRDIEANPIRIEIDIDIQLDIDLVIGGGTPVGGVLPVAQGAW